MTKSSVTQSISKTNQKKEKCDERQAKSQANAVCLNTITLLSDILKFHNHHLGLNMPIYKVVYKEFHQLIISNTQSFDTEDQEAWDCFRTDGIEFNNISPDDFPEEAPSDPQIWFDLISQLSTDEYEEREEDCWTMNKGGFDSSFDLEDEDGNSV